jgi:hypothetical protein
LAYEKMKQFSKKLLARNSVPLMNAPAGMSATESPLAVLVPLICVNGMVTEPFVRLSGVVTCRAAEAVPVVALGCRYEAPRYVWLGGLHTVYPS